MSTLDKMDINNYFNSEEVTKVQKIMKSFHDRLLLDKKIGNPEAVLISVYMACNEQKKSKVSEDSVKQIFISLGRTNVEFMKAIYEISGKRKSSKKLVETEGDNIALNFDGLNKVEETLNGI